MSDRSEAEETGTYQTVSCKSCGVKFAPEVSGDHCPVCDTRRPLSEEERMKREVRARSLLREVKRLAKR